jgi:endonuclease/exonuclease/phosphatase family metal-dependent hydrolase
VGGETSAVFHAIPRLDSCRIPESSVMRIVAWNINHRTREIKIPEQLAEAIAALVPDVIVLTEYVDGPTRSAFHASLAQQGFDSLLISERRPCENQVLMASRTPLEAGPIRAPEIAPSVPSNVLHVCLRDEGIEILGIRVPDYSKDPKTKRTCWDWIIETAKSVRDRPFVMIGDFNTDPKYPPSRCGDCIAKLVADGWQLASPADGASFWTLNGHAVCIDHAFVSGLLRVDGACYVTKHDGHIFAGKEPGALSDHAALVVDVSRGASFLGEWHPDELRKPQ